jgi:hypothetical protein
MLCWECGGEMRLVQVTKDTTMLVSGYEHLTWQCSGCSTVEQLMTFTREKTPAQTVPDEPAQIMLAEPTETAPAQPTQAVPVEPIQTVSVEAIQTMPVEPSKIAPLEPIQIIPPQPTHPEPPAAMPKMNARVKALEEKLHNLKERAKVAREAAGDTVRPRPINHDWDNKSSPVPAPSAPSETPSHVKLEEPLRSPTEPIVCPAPTSHDEPIAPESSGPVATKFRERLGELVRAMCRREFQRFASAPTR